MKLYNKRKEFGGVMMLQLDFLSSLCTRYPILTHSESSVTADPEN